MANELQTATASQKVLPDYPKLFSSRDSLRAQIMAATTRLTIALRAPAQATELAIWADRLRHFTPEQLTQAFIRAEATLQAWPSVAKLVEIIWESDYIADLAFMLDGLRKHKPEWRNIPESKTTARFIDGAWVDSHVIPGCPAPAIPRHLQRALEILGGGRIQDGLEALYKHPMARGYQYDPIEATRQQETIQRAFRAAYMQARGEELR